VILEARVLVVGWPLFGEVEPAGPGRVLLRHEHGAAGIELASGERTAAPPDAVPRFTFLAPSTSQLAERRDRHGVITTWSARGMRRELRGVEQRHIIAGDDEHLVVADPRRLVLVERASLSRRTLSVPGPPALHDRVTGGIGGQLNTPVLAVAPDFLVFVRSPALLVVRLPDVLRALCSDSVTWDLRLRLPLREGDRLWLPEGDLGRVTPPLDSQITETVELEVEDDPDRPLSVNWLATAGALPKLRPAQWATLATVRVPESASGAIELARELALHERQGAYGPVAAVYEGLDDLTSQDPDDADERRIDAYHDLLVATLWHQGSIYEATVFAIPVLVGFLCDPTTRDRERIAHTLALSAIAAAEHPALVDGVRVAFLRCLPAMLQPPAVPAHELDVWRRMLLAIGALDGKPAAWLKRIAKHDRDMRDLLDRLADDEELSELVMETDVG
jgi:hypothetical protein